MPFYVVIRVTASSLLRSLTVVSPTLLFSGFVYVLAPIETGI